MRTNARVPVARDAKGSWVAWCAALFVVSLVPAAALGQGVTGTVTGTVQDIQGGVVPGATVTLVSESQGTRMVPVVTNATGVFVVPNVTADTYSVRVEMPSFRTLNRTGVAVPPGSRISLGRLTLDVGGATEVVNVTSEAPLIQATTGERSFSVSTDSVLNLPLASRSYDSLLGLAPGIQTQDGLTFASRLGGGGGSNFMLDGNTAMDPGINRAAGKVSIEAIQEVKVATSGYQAEYGRSSGLQINAVTKSGTNRFHGSLYDAERRTWMNAKSEEQILLDEEKETVDQRDWGFTIGGPVGKPGGDNKLFFFFNYERNPRTRSDEIINYRMPSLLERKGDFSETTDNNGNPYPYIKDPLAGSCNASNQTACFRDGGVLGRIPQNRLYQPGINILNWYPEPNRAQPAGQAYNFQTDAYEVALLGYQPVIRGDWQPTPNLRVTFKYFMYQQPNTPIRGTLPGWNDSQEDDYGIYTPSGAVNYTLNATTFFEASWGGNYHHQEGCSVNGGEPNFCRNALRLNDAANRFSSGMGNIPYIFPDATIIEPGTLAHEILSNVPTTQWDGTRVVSVPSFTWGGRVGNSPPTNHGTFGSFILDTRTSNINISLTKVAGAHNFKFGYYYYNSNQRRGTGNMVGSIGFQNDTANAIDTSFPFANAAVGVFNQYTQTSRWAEGMYIAINHEWYAQDNWKIGRGLTLDYGVRLVNQIPQSDGYDKNSTFLPDRWVRANAPRVYVGACTQPVTTSNCSAGNTVAKDPLTGATISRNAALLIGTKIQGSGDDLNGIAIPGETAGVNEHGYSWPALAIAPRTGVAWDVKGDQRFVVRGGVGLFYDRPAANTTYSTVQNPPYTSNATLRYGTLQDLGSAVAPVATPSLSIFQYELPLPVSSQWNSGIQFAAPFNMAVDFSYAGQHSWNGVQGIQINNIDLGMAYRPELKDPTRAAITPVNSLVNTNPAAVRAYQGYAGISQTQAYNWRTYHSLQLSVNRRMSNGFQFSFADTMGLSDKGNASARIEHLADGTAVLRADQGKADELLGDQLPRAHFMKGSWVWQLPNMDARDAGFKKVLALITNDWSLSGVWNGETGTKYAVSQTYDSGNNQASLNLTGSPNYSARPVLAKTGDLGGCSSNALKQFDTSAFIGPLANSDGLESGNGYLKGCFISSTDVAIARTIQLGGGRSVQFRFDVFNLFNQHAITDRETSFELPSTAEADRATILNLPYDMAGNVIPTRALPNGDAGFGVATEYQEPRTMQLQVRFAF